MPELPEVEVTCRRIAPILIGRTFVEIHTTRDSYFFLTAPKRLRKGLLGRTVSGLQRRGKYLLAHLDNDARLILHLGMTGQLFASGAKSVRLLSATAKSSLNAYDQPAFRPDNHTHLRFVFDDSGPDVLFRDVRKFGKVQLLSPGERSRRLENLGIDALEISGSRLFQATRKRMIAIKTLLLDQTVLAGVGNIYADEALFLAGVRPRRRASRLTQQDCEAIAHGIVRVMRRSIDTGGSSISDYVTPDGRDGSYQDERHVYAREGERCLSCGAIIKRVMVGQRSAHYCPGCQKK